MKINILVLMFFFASLTSFGQKDNTLSKKELREGWSMLFNGTNTGGWTTPGGKSVPEGWTVNEGCLTAVKGGKGGDIVTVNEYGDFILSVDFNIEPGCNSGIKYYYSKYASGGNLGIEYQILDDELGEDNKKDNHLLGSFYDVMAPTSPKKKVSAPGKWNNVRIVSQNGKVEHWLNGMKILEFTRGGGSFTEAVSKSKFSKSDLPLELLKKAAFYSRSMEVGKYLFKNIKIKTLKIVRRWTTGVIS